MTPAEVTAWLKRRSQSYKRWADEQEYAPKSQAHSLDMQSRYTTAADLIETLTAERDEARHRFGVAIREQMKTFSEKPNFMTFVQLKHGIVGDILHALQDGCITMGKACEALAEVAHGAEPTFAKSDLSQLADDVLPAEEIAKLTAELAAAKLDGGRLDHIERYKHEFGCWEIQTDSTPIIWLSSSVRSSDPEQSKRTLRETIDRFIAARQKEGTR